MVLAAPPTAVPGGDTVQGLIFDQFSGNGIVITGSNNNQVFDVVQRHKPAGTAASQNGFDGIYVTAGSNFNIIGGALTSDRAATGDPNTPAVGVNGRNVFSGNGCLSNPQTASGIEIFGPGTSYNIVTNDIFGLGHRMHCGKHPGDGCTFNP